MVYEIYFYSTEWVIDSHNLKIICNNSQIIVKLLSRSVFTNNFLETNKQSLYFPNNKKKKLLKKIIKIYNEYNYVHNNI